MIMFKSALFVFSFDVRARDEQGVFSIFYEVIAGDLESAARFAVADLVEMGAEPLEIGEAEVADQKDLFARPGVRMKTARAPIP
jgi:hypothetical protein